jgi:hypothetical protein
MNPPDDGPKVVGFVVGLGSTLLASQMSENCVKILAQDPLLAYYSRMAIPGFRALLASFPIPGDPLGYYAGSWREAAVRHGLLPVYSDWECCYALTEGAEPVYTSDARWTDTLPLTNQRHRFIVLAQAAERYPELAFLRPKRAPADPTCRTCNGTGKRVVNGVTYEAILCECGGLGWYPAGSELGAV